MSFEADFEDLMAQDVTVVPKSSRNAYGKTTLGTGVVAKARVAFATRRHRSLNGEDIMSTATVWLPPPGYTPDGYSATPTVTTEDRVTLPDGTTHLVLAVDRPYDPDGVHHQKVYLE